MKKVKKPFYRYCIVPNCKNTIRNAPDKIFFSVPRDANIRKQWCKLMKRDDLSPTSCVYCCEDHFNVEKDAENYIQYKIMTIQNGHKVTLRLKKGVLPHKFECHKNLCLKNGVKIPHRQRLKKKKKLSKGNGAVCDNDADMVGECPYECCLPGPSKETSHTDVITLENIIDWAGNPSKDISQIDMADSGIKEEYESDTSNEPSHINLADCEIKIEDESYSDTAAVYKDIVSPKNLLDSKNDSALTNIDIADSEIEIEYKINYSSEHPHLDIIDLEDNVNCESDSNVLSVNIPCNITYNIRSGQIEDNFNSDKKFKNLMRISTFAAIEREPKILLGLQKRSFHLIKQLSENLNLPTVNILLTLKKIKLNESFSILALQFGCIRSTISSIFSNSIVCIAGKMKEFIIWPTPSMIFRNLPMTFRANYSNVISIIDCLEIQFEKPLKAKHEALCWSNFRKCHTFKYLISYTPDGHISFISKGFSGGVTDVSIIEECGFLDHLSPNTAVMAYRRFVGLSRLLEEKKCSLITLPLISKTTLSANENVRLIGIHVERIRSKLREFNILLPACSDNNIIPFLDDIVLVACGLINAQYGKYKTTSA